MDGGDSGRRASLLKAWALEEGFDRAGVAALEAPEHGEAFLRWLARGDQAGMGYLERRVEARLDPTIDPRPAPGALSASRSSTTRWRARRTPKAISGHGSPATRAALTTTT